VKTFENIQKALEYTVQTLIPNDHAYIINVMGQKGKNGDIQNIFRKIKGGQGSFLNFVFEIFLFAE
jgi:hypothetical protein